MSHKPFLPTVCGVVHVSTRLGIRLEIITRFWIRHLSLMTPLASEISLCLLWHQFNLMEELWSKWLKIKHYPQCRNERVPARRPDNWCLTKNKSFSEKTHFCSVAAIAFAAIFSNFVQFTPILPAVIPALSDGEVHGALDLIGELNAQLFPVIKLAVTALI